MMTLRTVAAAGVLGVMSLLPAPSHAQEACPSTRLPPVSVSATKKGLTGTHEVLIVALGSSSTEGVRASSAANSYPARLQGDLTAALPNAHVAVINRGIGGQDALEEIARLDTDVIAMRPDMVIWQVGANGAMGHADPDVFRKLVSTGIERLKTLGIDVILMDNQRSPMILASPEHGVFEQILAELSVKYQVSLFSRGALMDAWKASGLSYEHFLASDSVHMNDIGYRCTAEALARSIEAGLGAADAAKIAAIRQPEQTAPVLHASN